MCKEEQIKFYADTFNEEHWKKYSSGFENIEIPNKLKNLLPDDVLHPLIYLLGDDVAYVWINKKLHAIDNRTAIELSKTDTGLKALKAFIMRMPC